MRYRRVPAQANPSNQKADRGRHEERALRLRESKMQGSGIVLLVLMGVGAPDDSEIY